MGLSETTPSVPADAKTRFDFAARVHVYTHDYIRFADTKASAILAACGFIFSGLLTRSDAIGAMIAKASNLSCIIYMIGFVGISALIFTVWNCVSCIMPRLNSTGEGLVYWDQVALTADYAEKVNNLTSEEATAQLATHVKVISSIVRKKYEKVHWAIWGFCVTLAATLALCFLFIFISAKFPPTG